MAHLTRGNLHLFNVFAHVAHLLLRILVEVVAAVSGSAELRQVVVEGLLADTYLVSRVLETEPAVIEVLVVVSVVKPAPCRHLLDHIGHCSLFIPRSLFDLI